MVYARKERILKNVQKIVQLFAGMEFVTEQKTTRTVPGTAAIVEMVSAPQKRKDAYSTANLHAGMASVKKMKQQKNVHTTVRPHKYGRKGRSKRILRFDRIGP